MIYITGDKHRRFKDVELFCERMGTSADKDVMIVLGDAGINYSIGWDDEKLKRYLSRIPITLFCIHGNHEIRPYRISSYDDNYAFHGGRAYFDKRYPNQVFAIDGQTYDFDGKKCFVIGGAYSVDRYFRTENVSWWSDEQPDDFVKTYVTNRMDAHGWKQDIILSHTCPYKYIPREMFISGVDQSTVDDSTERWLGSIEEKCEYRKWYCGHYHTDKSIDRIRFLFNDIIELR